MNDAVFVVGLRCRRCAGTSSTKVTKPRHVAPDRTIACPHCFTEEAVGFDYSLSQTYDVEGVAEVDAKAFDAMYGIDAYDDDADLLTDTQRGDFVAVEVEGASCADRARDRGVERGTVTKTVSRARSKVYR